MTEKIEFKGVDLFKFIFSLMFVAIGYPISFMRRKDEWIASNSIPSPPEDQA